MLGHILMSSLIPSQLNIGLLLTVATLLPSSLNSPVSIDVSDDEDWSTELIYPSRRKAQKENIKIMKKDYKPKLLSSSV